MAATGAAGFTYGELMSQNFPGSNIDAWLTANGVTEDMKSTCGPTPWPRATLPPGPPLTRSSQKDEAVEQNVAFNRLQATSAQTRTGFQLAGTMSGAYANKELANSWFNDLMGTC